MVHEIEPSQSSSAEKRVRPEIRSEQVADLKRFEFFSLVSNALLLLSDPANQKLIAERTTQDLMERTEEILGHTQTENYVPVTERMVNRVKHLVLPWIGAVSLEDVTNTLYGTDLDETAAEETDFNRNWDKAEFNPLTEPDTRANLILVKSQEKDENIAEPIHNTDLQKNTRDLNILTPSQRREIMIKLLALNRSRKEIISEMAALQSKAYDWNNLVDKNKIIQAYYYDLEIINRDASGYKPKRRGRRKITQDNASSYTGENSPENNSTDTSKEETEELTALTPTERRKIIKVMLSQNYSRKEIIEELYAHHRSKYDLNDPKVRSNLNRYYQNDLTIIKRDELMGKPKRGRRKKTPEVIPVNQPDNSDKVIDFASESESKKEPDKWDFTEEEWSAIYNIFERGFNRPNGADLKESLIQPCNLSRKEMYEFSNSAKEYFQKNPVIDEANQIKLEKDVYERLLQLVELHYRDFMENIRDGKKIDYRLEMVMKQLHRIRSSSQSMQIFRPFT